MDEWPGQGYWALGYALLMAVNLGFAVPLMRPYFKDFSAVTRMRIVVYVVVIALSLMIGFAMWLHSMVQPR
jgi:hypothetical protein